MQRVGPEVVSLQRPSGGPPCNPPLCHPVAEGRLASTVVASLWRPAGAMFIGKSQAVEVLSEVRKPQTHNYSSPSDKIYIPGIVMKSSVHLLQ